MPGRGRMDPNRRTDSRRGGSGLRNDALDARPNFQPARDSDDWHSRGSGSRDERDVYSRAYDSRNPGDDFGGDAVSSPGVWRRRMEMLAGLQVRRSRSWDRTLSAWMS